jgi:hypothetical protein
MKNLLKKYTENRTLANARPLIAYIRQHPFCVLALGEEDRCTIAAAKLDVETTESLLKAWSPPAGVTAIGFDDPAALHDVIKDAVGE